MQNIEMVITSTSDKELYCLEFNDAKANSATTPITLRLYNNSAVSTTINYLTAHRADMFNSTPAGEDSELTEVLGSEMVSENWLEARLGTTGAWTPLDSWTNKLDLGAIAASAYATFQVRLNIPSGATTFGTMAFCLGVKSK